MLVELKCAAYANVGVSSLNILVLTTQNFALRPREVPLHVPRALPPSNFKTFLLKLPVQGGISRRAHPCVTLRSLRGAAGRLGPPKLAPQHLNFAFPASKAI